MSKAKTILKLILGFNHNAEYGLQNLISQTSGLVDWNYFRN